ncbi:hypothetical protein M758_UG244700 [Ceratodon purpureus]|nr:hypothetical protein M758_UG244700 [Ceratodon purpureus]
MKTPVTRHGRLGNLTGIVKKLGGSQERCKRSVLYEYNRQDPVASAIVSPSEHLLGTPSLRSHTFQARRNRIEAEFPADLQTSIAGRF